MASSAERTLSVIQAAWVRVLCVLRVLLCLRSGFRQDTQDRQDTHVEAPLGLHEPSGGVQSVEVAPSVVGAHVEVVGDFGGSNSVWVAGDVPHNLGGTVGKVHRRSHGNRSRFGGLKGWAAQEPASAGDGDRELPLENVAAGDLEQTPLLVAVALNH